MVRVAMVGYTNAGKSTLLRLMSGADVLVEDRLFATLDTTVRKIELASTQTILLSDTVGFIRKLPSHLIASFRSTLAEVTEADALLHVVDVSHPLFAEQIEVVNHTLEDIHAAGKPTIYVFNKIDQLSDRSIIREIGQRYESAVFISAERGINISSLETQLLEMLDRNIAEQTITIKQSDYRTVAKLHEFSEVTGTEYIDNSIRVHFRINQKNMERLWKLLGQKHYTVQS
jgi:GTP-binding protein HflX